MPDTDTGTKRQAHADTGSQPHPVPPPVEPPGEKRKSLKKELGLFDVYALGSGGLFSSGFFLLPGLAFAYAGPSTILAYPIAALLMLPALLSMAELSTALPRAGGPYYFLDRSLGPAMGTIGGAGTWLALVLKSGFALIGMGAYVAVLMSVSDGATAWLVKALAVGLTLGFTLLNIFGAKETTRLQNALVISLLCVLGFFIVQGGYYVFGHQGELEVSKRFHPFLHRDKGYEGLIGAVGLVFVSFAGLIKVASVSEEVKRPDRNLPLAMVLALATTTAINMIGVMIMVSVLAPGTLASDLTPAATAAQAFFTWLPGSLGLWLVVGAAVVAFASSGNAGIFSASRYPLAMSRDDLVGKRFAKLGRTGTPITGILLTSGAMIAFIVLLDAQGVAKLASAFNLLIFGLMHIAVIVMRESRIESYDPGFRSPLYPWTQLVGVGVSCWLITEMGWLSIGFSVLVIAAGAGWYAWYGRPRVARDGAIFHVFERLGRHRHDALHTEFREIMKEKGARESDPFDDTVARAIAIDAEHYSDFDQLVRAAAEQVAPRIGLDPASAAERFIASSRAGGAIVSHQAILPHFRVKGIARPEMVVVRSRRGVQILIETGKTDAHGKPELRSATIHAAFMLVSPDDDPGIHLRILAQIAAKLDDEHFMEAWKNAADEQKLKEVLLRDERFLSLRIGRVGQTEPMIGKALRDIDWPEETLVALIRRGGETYIPKGNTVLEENDRLTIIGNPRGIDRIAQRYGIRKAPKPEAGKQENGDENGDG